MKILFFENRAVLISLNFIFKNLLFLKINFNKMFEINESMQFSINLSNIVRADYEPI